MEGRGRGWDEGRKPQRAGEIFNGGSQHLETPSKDFHLAIGEGLGWLKWLKMGKRKVLNFIQLFLHYFLLVKIFLAKLKNLYIQYA